MSGLTCEDARNLFDAHLNGELRPALDTELNAHRVRCPACRHELALLEVAGQVIAADDAAPALDEDFASRLMACVSERRTSRPLWHRRVVGIGARALAAAACIALVVGYFSRPKKDVAGWHSESPSASVSHDRPGGAASPARVEGPISSRNTFQAQVERALTEWRNDASSLKKIYDFITPQIHERMRRERSENAHDQPDLFEPGHPDALPGDVAIPRQIIEDI